MLFVRPANTFDVPLNPPIYAYFDADIAPSGPCARRKPNSNNDCDGPTARRIRDALVVTNDA